MIQDITPNKLDNHYDGCQTPQPEDFVILYDNRKLLVNITKEQITFPKVSDLKNTQNLIYLFSIAKERFFLSRQKLTPDGFFWLEVKKLTSYPITPKSYVFAAFTAMHLAEWYRTKQFCGICGNKLHHDQTERAMLCDCCGQKFYPRLNPAVIVGVTNGNQLLLTKYREGYGYNALVAGFVEIGETLEDAVAREVSEETGLSVYNIRYYKSQPWGIASDLLTGFFCDVDGDTTIHMDTDELKYAQWVEREDIELQPTDYSLTNEMMRLFKEHAI